jgi:hypothetical protein
MVLFAGLGGAGGYWYFALGAQWPLPFMQQAVPTVGPAAPAADDSVGGDSLLLGNMLPVMGDSLAVGDSGGPTTGDSVPSVAPLPETGTLIVRGLPNRGQLLVNGEVRSDTVLQLAPGSQSIRVTLTGYEDFEDVRPLARGDTVALTVPAMTPLVRQVEPPPPPKVDYCAVDPPDYNKDGSCYDRAPRPDRRAIISLQPGASPASTVLWVKVGADGSVLAIRRKSPSPDQRFNIDAQRFAQDSLRYTPAQKGGRAVSAWFELPVRGLPR